MQYYKLGYLYVMIAALLWAVSGNAARFLFLHGMTAYQLVQIRITIAVVILLVWLGLFKRNLLVIKRKDILYFILLGTFGMGCVQFTYLYAISKIYVAIAIFIQYLAPVFIVLYTIVIAHEKPSRLTIISIIIALLGCYLIVGGYRYRLIGMDYIGIVSALLSALTFAWYSVRSEYGMRTYNPLTVLFYTMFFAGIMWNCLYPPFSAFFYPYPMTHWIAILYIAIFGTCLAFALYYKGINLIRSTHASLTAILEPISALFISYFWLNETVDSYQIVGGFLVIFTIVLLQSKQEEDKMSPEKIRQNMIENQ